ncbi:myo-inositol-1(or 4)-monophosphatase [Scopulibacillus darangshiensis]|uniref:Myo-inositol-1(Or 4)-monophosphatase n=1 Tax=Scopulibacillus darangshiensis TaxID=442528 RepID=A0A4R2P9H4_9BACL|nr:inositol monophosphatase family protein [Scopulibacillus darangshiensis]TCP30515.1 myo-inositol-1(or 4)-monophosphatase [Scopulibacillus darangshiensis]
MKNEFWKALHCNVTEWMKEAGGILEQSFTDQLDVQYKTSYDDLVTNMDKQIEQFFIQRIHQHYPDHRIISEEGFGDDVTSSEGILWLIDPIDGTMNFVHQRRHFAISVGIYEDGVGRAGFIYDVIADDLYHCIKGQGAFLNQAKLPMLKDVKLNESLFSINATWVNKNRRIDPEIMQPIAKSCRGTRSYGSAAIELAYVASGTLDAYFTMRLAPWDYGAGLILIEEVGGKATRVDGSPIDLLNQNSLLVGKKGLQEEIVQHIKNEVSKGKFIQKAD